MTAFSTLFVTGGSGFIGASFCRLAAGLGYRVVNLDKLTYAGSRAALADLEGPRYRFVEGDIADGARVLALLREERPRAIVHLAAESHVDRSIDAPAAFVETNVAGTVRLLDAALAYWRELAGEARDGFRFVHVSTDEVFGDLGDGDGRFAPGDPYAPSSPYAASKAASDHFVRAWRRTYGLPVIVSASTNNYGPWQYPEKLVPLAIRTALRGEPIPLYGTGTNVRDWLFVEDHARAILCVLEAGRVGESYLAGARNARTNREVVRAICGLLDARLGGDHAALIAEVPDRPGHDLRYAADPAKVEALGWRAQVPFEEGLARTVDWYLANRDWPGADGTQL